MLLMQRNAYQVIQYKAFLKGLIIFSPYVDLKYINLFHVDTELRELMFTGT